jgi:hypothetical protein
MLARKRLLLGIAAVVLGIAVGTVSAALINVERTVIFRSVEVNGTLGRPIFTAVFIELLNTTNGDFIGSAKGTVRNFSNLPQVYIDNPSATIPGANFSLYAVEADGDARLVASGQTPP